MMGRSDGKGRSDGLPWPVPAGAEGGAGWRHPWAGRVAKGPGDFWRVPGDELAGVAASGLVLCLCRHLAFLQY